MRATAAELCAQVSDTPAAEITGLFAGQAGYATPKVDVRGVVFRGEEVTLVRERSDGGWTLPGGWADVDDTPSAAVEREVAEEAGFEVRATKLVACLDRTRWGHPPAPFRTWKLYFRCEPVGALPEAPVSRDALEITDVGFFGQDALPPLSQIRVTRPVIDRCFEHLRDPDRLTDFD